MGLLVGPFLILKCPTWLRMCLVAGLCTLLMTWLLVRKMICRVHEVVPGLRAITMTARLNLLISWCRNLRILVLSWELRPLAGLLVKTTVGWSVTVWV